MQQSVQSGSDPLKAGRANSLGLDGQRLVQVIELMDKAGKDGGGSVKRTFTRWPFANASVTLEIEQQGGNRFQIKVAARNLSNGGMSLLHSNFVYPGSACWVSLTRNNGEQVTVPGNIARCSHFSGVVHEIGVKFDKQIDASEFVKLDPMTEAFSREAVDPTSLAGTVLVVDDSNIDFKLMQHMLEETRLRLTHASTYEDAVAQYAGAWDVIMCDQHLDGEHTGANLVREMREKGITTPVVALTADDGPQARQDLRGAKVNAILFKPTSKKDLLRAITEFVMVRRDAGGVIASNLDSDDPASGMVREYVEELHAKATKLRSCIESDDAMACYAICLQVRGSSGNLGFDQLEPLAAQAAQNLAASMSVEESKRYLVTLAEACERSRAA